jgi:hypothetical protein
MHIIHALYKLTKLIINKAKRVICCEPTDIRAASPDEEASNLLRNDERLASQTQQRSLTSTYTDYTHSNEALTLFLCHAAAYYCLAVLGFSFLADNHSIIDSLYMASVIFTTIGYGDIQPTNPPSRIFVIFLATYGIIILGIFLGIMVSHGERAAVAGGAEANCHCRTCRILMLYELRATLLWKVKADIPARASGLFNDLWLERLAVVTVVQIQQRTTALLRPL